MLKENVRSKIQKEKIFYDSKKVTQIAQKIYSQRKSEDSSGSFRLERTGRINFSII